MATCTSSPVFEAKTHAAHAFKILIETLNQYLNKSKGGSFVINQKGIFLRNANVKEDVLCDVSLLAENFQDYTLKVNEICFSINLNTFYTEMLKKIRKKDSITIQILSEGNKMFLKVIKESPDSKGNTSSAKTVITSSSCVFFEPPTGYGLPVNIISKNFQQSCREIKGPANKEIEVTCWNEKSLRFFANKKDGVVENEANFAARDETKVQVETFRAKFSAPHIIRPAKLAGLSETVKIFVKTGLPLCYKLRVGSLGDFAIYIKNTEQVQSEQDTADDEDEEEDC